MTESKQNKGRKSNFTPERAKIIREMLDNGLSQVEIAVALNLTKSTVSRWVAQLRDDSATPVETEGSLGAFLASVKWKKEKFDEAYEAYHSGDMKRRQEIEDEIFARCDVESPGWRDIPYLRGEWLCLVLKSSLGVAVILRWSLRVVSD